MLCADYDLWMSTYRNWINYTRTHGSIMKKVVATYILWIELKKTVYRCHDDIEGLVFELATLPGTIHDTKI